MGNKDIWIRITNKDEDIINLRDCINIYKKDVEKWEDGRDFIIYKIKFKYIEEEFSLSFKNISKRNNVYEHICRIISLEIIDPNIEQLTL